MAVAKVHQSMNEASSFSMVIRIIRKDGQQRFVQNVTNILVDADGRPTKMFGIIQDITDSKLQEDSLRSALLEHEILLREVHHRVKNNLASIISLIDLQKKVKLGSKEQSGFDELALRIRSMSLVHEKLYHSKLSHLNFYDYATTLASTLLVSFYHGHTIQFTIQSTVEISLDIAIPCGMIVNELITNSLKYAFPNGMSRSSDTPPEICIIMTRTGQEYELIVSDNGVGLPENYDWENASTLGQRLVRMLGQHQLGAQITVDTTEGTKFTFTFVYKDKIKAQHHEK